MYKISLIEDRTKQNEIIINNAEDLFQYVHTLVNNYNAFDWKYVSMQLAEFVEFSSQCIIDVGYTTAIKIEEC